MGDSTPVIKKVIAVSGLLVFGALNTLTSKILFTMKAPVAEGSEPKYFNKPFFVTFMMFVAMTLVILAHYVQRRNALAGDSDTKTAPLLRAKPVSEFKAFIYIGVPATFDLIATGLMLYGLTLMSASIYQMLRGSMIVFSALVYKFVMKQEFFAFKWLGVSFCVVGITCVGLANVLNTKGGFGGPGPQVTEYEAWLGIFLVIAAQVVQASQVVAEEFLMKNVQLPPLMIVGYEGTWGTVESLMIMFPLLLLIHGQDNGHLEDTVESVSMISNSSSLQGLILLYLFSCSTFNVTSVFVTKFFNAIHRTIFEASRTIFIWGFGLLVHYYNPEAAFGEAWLPYSYFELIGFGFLLFGQCIYGQVLIVPGMYYPEAKIEPLLSPCVSPH